MPEAPEVERVRRSLEPSLIGSLVSGVVLRRRDVVVTPGDPPGGFARQRVAADRASRPRPVPRADLLLGERVATLDRRGKQLAIIAESGRILLVHLGMTGKLVVGPAGAAGAGTPIAHTHASWTLERGRDRFLLRFVDPRRFGGLWTLACPEALRERWGMLGPDATIIRDADLGRSLAGSQRAVKAALLDQRIVAGVGNIYADEALFGARIAPARPAATLSGADRARLAAEIRGVVAAAVEAGGSTIRDYTDATGARGTAQALHRVYGRGGCPCVRCGGVLATAVLAQRTTVWCPNCQR